MLDLNNCVAASVDYSYHDMQEKWKKKRKMQENNIF